MTDSPSNDVLLECHLVLKHVSHIGCRDRGSLSLLKERGLTGVLDGDFFSLHPPFDGPLAEDPKIERFVGEARALGATPILCSELPSMEVVGGPDD